MLFTLTTTHQPATDLGFLLHKHPGKVQTFEVAAGTAHVFYPQAEEHQCTVGLLLELDPIELVRRGRENTAFSLGRYVNDRPYVASSMLAVALGKVFRTALGGRCEAKPELAATPLPLQVHLPAVPCHGPADLVTRLFEPLGWTVDARPIPMTGWGDSPYVDLRLTGTLRLAEALNHLYVLLPVLDNVKHYWVAEDEVEKLLRAGADWLGGHPERELVSRRYLRHRRGLVDAALTRLAEAEDTEPEALDNALDPAVITETPAREPLAATRRDTIMALLKEIGAKQVVDLGCGGGALLRGLLADLHFTRILGVDVSAQALANAERGLNLDRMSEHVAARLTLRQSALTYVDAGLRGFDAAVLMEVVEHVDPPRLPALARAVFGGAQPASVLVTTPNVEYNVRFPDLPAGEFRHPDHRFEWTRAEFRDWAQDIAQRYGYHVEFRPVGPADPEVGPPTQLALFRRTEVTR
ncbi:MULTISPECIES: 3' terminal RNA ribose 2'-O-methyltransferase Hen1 [unclassified Crossiella]|uniref:3' terminal RNA ribose 2'-O-methyltransferase Hen1 n=1 Tax=unclassified Crossiella TaxID=2620835 RepID=UPI001FFE543F|nr:MULTISPECIES: 3' terminal RNA ribose 2'-O-methyltransferase Hen1 [unclassified Crossiella]MCK2237099.1 3' terminal RNA ribose 2'-O-methyltransferase Hen1 [Crossiella sp. S99.2]MCK2250767.1 3' terminal RNA ribose 2'-O-methyltransferase Hen1 [Crossiella sp. S99.1]